MSSRSKLIWIGAGATISHFLVTWYLVLQSWGHAWAGWLVAVLWFPGRLAVSYFGGSKYGNMALLVGTSVLWGLAATSIIALVFFGARQTVGMFSVSRKPIHRKT
jgi:hypothetical protein